MFLKEKTSVILVRLAIGTFAGTGLLAQFAHAQETSLAPQAQAEATPGVDGSDKVQ